MTKKERYQHYVINPSTGEVQWYFPMEIETTSEDAAGSDYLNSLKLSGHEIGMSKIGFREFKAIMIPVDSKAEHDILIKDELDKQDEMKLDGRCFIQAKIGGLKRCPRQMPNPSYTEGSGLPKTIMTSCKGCPYEHKKHEHTFVNFSALQSTDDDGNTEDFDPANPIGYNSTYNYDKLSDEFLDYVRENKPKLLELATLLCKEYVQTEAANILGKSTSTIGSQTEKLRELLNEFLDIEL